MCISGRKDFPNANIGAVAGTEHVPCSFDDVGASGSAIQAYPDPDCVHSASGNNFSPPAMLQFAKTRKLSIERSDLRKYVWFILENSYMSFFNNLGSNGLI